MNLKSSIAILFLVWSLQNVTAQEPKLKKAFNGKNLKGWVAPENNTWWSVQDGLLVAKSGPEQKGSILWTKKVYGDFVIAADFLFGEGTIDSGIFIRTEKQQIQIGISGSLKRDMTGSPYIPGKGYPVEAKDVAKLLKLKDWNTMKVKAVGNIYTVWLNGQEVMQYESEDALKEGPIGLQLHPGKDMTISFRNIGIGAIK
ncbi:DUF1080 domain-containing protein [uncultured Kriegella sp.]|uniref:3-keto-disaccharide hydrolase n=1 Tax=uncultured Kriegella sp. TaxID=1798910 RepID=UPI0030D9D811|tara:strand:- start:209092 stop:209691 length:600 start_codon:yes stop_codon:yes gene_type:complete